MTTDLKYLDEKVKALMEELWKHAGAVVECESMGDALCNILKDADVEDVISDLALDDIPGA